ncbi:MAG: GMC family oxidoreductase [Deltaproteobacteria bacterium]|nr:GMC family oxidoreductase [Deltaproteobacteria bacterium]
MTLIVDAIVVGGGSSGCIVAAELLKAGRSVALLEAGPDAEDHPETLVADGYKQAFINDELMHERFSVTRAGWGDRRLFMGSGRGLGGSGSINAMVYTRGAKEDFDSWPEGWRWDDVVPAFESVEAVLRPRSRESTDFTERCIAAAEGVGFRRKRDLNDGDLHGVLGHEAMNYEGEARRSSYVAFLREHRDSPKLHVITEAVVDRLLIERGRVVGVRWYEGDQRHELRAAETILCAGTLATPAILLRSGVGPAEDLRALDIPVLLDQPGVGANLHDHPNVQLFFRGDRDVDTRYPQLYGFDRVGHGPSLVNGQADTCYVFYPARSSFREGLMRLLPAIALPEPLYDQDWVRGGMRKAIEGLFGVDATQSFVKKLWGIVVILGKPESRGRLWLRNADPSAKPAIDPGYFKDPADMQTLLHGIDRAREIAASAPLPGFGNTELIPGPLQRDVERWARKNVMTTYHYAGTCRMGDDAHAVVDTKLRFNGLEGLRVADASVMPVTPVAALNAPSMMIGYRASQLLQS